MNDHLRDGATLDAPNAPMDGAVSRPLCAFCRELPSGTAGHEGLAQQVATIPATLRSYVRLACAFCGSRWARRRVNARTIEWRRIAD